MTTKMGFTSPQKVYDDPKTWLNVPHSLHEQMGKLMVMMFPDWKTKLEAAKVHCLKCEGHEPFKVIMKETMKSGFVTGYIGTPPDVELMVKDEKTVKEWEKES